MIVLNFGHPLSSEALSEIRRLMEYVTIGEIKEVRVQVSQERCFADQAKDIIDTVGWDGRTWQQNRFVLVPPGLSSMALPLIAEIHGRCGYFPTMIRMKPVGGSPPVFMPAEVVDLTGIREEARTRR